MIEGHDILVLSDDLDGLPTSTIHLFKHIAPHNRVFWFNIVSRMPRMTAHDLKKIWRMAGQALTGAGRYSGEAAAPGIPGVLSSTTPLIVPVFKKPVRHPNKRLLDRHIRGVCEEFEVSRPLVFTTWPSTVDFIKGFEAQKTIYYCVDDWANYPALNAADFLLMESELIDVADGFAATSQVLYEKRRDVEGSLYLPHGVDYDHFATDAAESTGYPELDNLTGPVVGFFGLIAEWIDTDLIAYLADRFRSAKFVLIGKSVVDTNQLASRPNIVRLPEVDYSILPKLAARFDVGLIPFVINDLTRAVNPLKLLEYLSIGVPVLATRLPDLENVDGPVYLAESHAEFAGQLECILAEKPRPELARSIGRANSWAERANLLSGFIESL